MSYEAPKHVDVCWRLSVLSLSEHLLLEELPGVQLGPGKLGAYYAGDPSVTSGVRLRNRPEIGAVRSQANVVIDWARAVALAYLAVAPKSEAQRAAVLTKVHSNDVPLGVPGVPWRPTKGVKAVRVPSSARHWLGLFGTSVAAPGDERVTKARKNTVIRRETAEFPNVHAVSVAAGILAYPISIATLGVRRQMPELAIAADSNVPDGLSPVEQFVVTTLANHFAVERSLGKSGI